MTKRKPKKRNLTARKPLSRHSKVQCQVCDECISFASLKAHYAVSHPAQYAGGGVGYLDGREDVHADL